MDKIYGFAQKHNGTWWVTQVTVGRLYYRIKCKDKEQAFRIALMCNRAFDMGKRFAFEEIRERIMKENLFQ